MHQVFKETSQLNIICITLVISLSKEKHKTKVDNHTLEII